VLNFVFDDVFGIMRWQYKTSLFLMVVSQTVFWVWVF